MANKQTYIYKRQPFIADMAYEYTYIANYMIYYNRRKKKAYGEIKNNIILEC